MVLPLQRCSWRDTELGLQEHGRLQAKISSQIQQAIDNHIPSLVDRSVSQTTCRTSTVCPRDQDDPHDDVPLAGENRKRQKTSEYEAYYGVEHWKNPHAKIFYIKRQKDPGKLKEFVYLNSKIIQVIKTYWELGHEHKFITEIVARRANECIVPDYAETCLLWSLLVFIRSSVIWERVHDFQLGIESYQHKVNLIVPIISFPGIEKHKMFSIIYEPVHGIIYKNNKKEKRVMRHSEIHKFCDATLNKVLEGLKSYNNDVNEIEVSQPERRWEMYVNGRPLGPRREHPE
ncbi:hypothetical protein Tco_0291156 [Tanacetum coccineum]